jgi:hypothetical protein
MGQLTLTGEGSEALPRTEVTYPLTRKAEYDYMVHTKDHSYMNPYNEAVGGNITVKYMLASEVNIKSRYKPVATKSLRDSRAPHISAAPLDFSFAKITACEDIPIRAQKLGAFPSQQMSGQRLRSVLTGANVIGSVAGILEWSGSRLKTLRLARAHNPMRFDQSLGRRSSSSMRVGGGKVSASLIAMARGLTDGLKSCSTAGGWCGVAAGEH